MILTRSKSHEYSFDANNHIVGYSYDAAGNLLNDTFHSYTYDAENRVTAVDGGSTASYAYDAAGRVVHRSLGTTTLDFALNLDGKAISELANGTWDRSEIYAAGTHVATYADGITYFFHPDWLGSVRAETRYDGTVAGNMTNLAFGDGQVWTGRLPSWQNFAQGDIDNASALDLFMFRQYSNVQGRWISPDPAGLAAVDPTNPQSWNRYAYVGNNPLAYVDPLGLELESPWGVPSPLPGEEDGCNPAYAFCQAGICSYFPVVCDHPGPSGGDGGGGGGGGSIGAAPGGGGQRVGGRYGDVNNETLGLPPGINLKALTLGDLFGLNPNGPCDFGVCTRIGIPYTDPIPTGSGSPDSPWTFHTSVFAPFLTICGDFWCDEHRNHHGSLPFEGRDLQDSSNIIFVGAGLAREAGAVGIEAAGEGASSGFQYLFRPASWLNQGQYWRIGFGRNGGLQVFRSVFFGWKKTWWTGGPL